MRNYSEQRPPQASRPVGKHADPVATARDQADAVGAVAPREGSQPIDRPQPRAPHALT